MSSWESEKQTNAWPIITHISQCSLFQFDRYNPKATWVPRGNPAVPRAGFAYRLFCTHSILIVNGLVKKNLKDFGILPGAVIIRCDYAPWEVSKYITRSEVQYGGGFFFFTIIIKLQSNRTCCTTINSITSSLLR